MSESEADQEKVRLAIVKPETLTLEHWQKMFEHLSGRAMTREEIEELKSEMAKDDALSGSPRPVASQHTRADGP